MEPGGVRYHGYVGGLSGTTRPEISACGTFRPLPAGSLDRRTVCSAPAITRAQVPFWRDVNYQKWGGQPDQETYTLRAID
jgi:hypothetical protein